ncbi:MAG: IMPACT family protein [Oscillospiraceae bacterium]|jgi:uncharacterized YigZ family protein|nr:IMPACT family protein [Oscillospiraceae bacterium]
MAERGNRPDPPLEPYRTLAREAQAEIVEKKSRFIGWGAHVTTEDEARAFLDRVRREHREASHVCHAFRVERDSRNQPAVQRMSDAGEPSGTAGSPILAAITARGIVDCCVAVVRYFGGTLLGAGGLTRAYGKACVAALDACGSAIMEPTAFIKMVVPYSLWDTLRYAVSSQPCAWMDVAYTDEITATLKTRTCDEELVLRRVRETTNARVRIIDTARAYEMWPE